MRERNIIEKLIEKLDNTGELWYYSVDGTKLTNIRYTDFVRLVICRDIVDRYALAIVLNRRRLANDVLRNYLLHNYDYTVYAAW